MEIKLNDIIVNPDLTSIERIPMSDEEYFGPRYSEYTSNSRLKLINPDSGGSPSKYKTGFKIKNDRSLILGSAVHCALLQPDEFKIAPDLKKPTAKLGLVIDKIENTNSIEKPNGIIFKESGLNPSNTPQIKCASS